MVASDAVPKAVAKVGKAGTSADYSRGDHQHALDPNLFTEQVNVQLEGVDKGSRQGVNFKAGSKITLTVTEDAPNERVNVQIAAQTPTATITTVLTFGVEGTLTTGTNKTFEIVAPCTLTIVKVKAHVKTAPTGATLIVDVNKAGTTIFTNQANRPTIAIGATDDDSGTPDVTALAEGNVLSIDIDQIGSTVAGADLTLEVVCVQAVTFS
jgi:hypothetical protein